jgi:hypothetical protein
MVPGSKLKKDETGRLVISVLKTGPVIESVKVLVHWSNHWITGQTAWLNRIKPDDSVV